MVEKIRTCFRRRIDGGHNVVCDVGPNVVVLDVDLRNNNVALSYSGRVCSSSSSVFTNNAGISMKNGFGKEAKDGEGNMDSFIRKLKRFLPMNLPNPKGESFDKKEFKEEDKKSQV